METNRINLFIVDENVIMVNNLKHYLQSKFGPEFSITNFNDGESCLREINSDTHIVIMDYSPKRSGGLDILKKIKVLNPKTEVIMLSVDEDIAMAIKLVRNGATGYIVKGKGSLKKIKDKIYHILTGPIRILVRELGVSKFMAAFLTTFIVMGIVVYIVMNTMY